MIYGERIKQAREFRGLTQTRLASLIGVKQSAISQMEKDEFTPSSQLLEAIGQRTGFLPSFFTFEPVANLPLGTLNYRAAKYRTARGDSEAYQYANIVYQQIKNIAPDVSVPRCRVPQLSNVEVVKAAQITRDALGYSPDEPIKRLMRGVEDAGVFIFSIPRPIPRVDAFSTWAEIDEARPVIGMIAGKPMDRLRLSISHEIGHLVLHGRISKRLKFLEDEAYEFAAEFLLPEQAMRHEITHPVTLTSLARLKLRWGTSIQALIMRCKALKAITDRQAKYLFAQMSSQGWRTREPSNLDPSPEQPSTVRSMIEAKYRNLEDYARKTGMEKDTATEFYLHA